MRSGGGCELGIGGGLGMVVELMGAGFVGDGGDLMLKDYGGWMGGVVGGGLGRFGLVRILPVVAPFPDVVVLGCELMCRP